MRALWLLFALAGLFGPRVRAEEPITLRMAAIAPDGAGWARELAPCRAISRPPRTAPCA